MSIDLFDICAGYDGFALDGITAKITTGSLTALIGPNGCGKSTLLKTIARQLSPGGGKVEIAGQNIARLRTKSVAQLIASLPQHPVVPPGITIEQLVAYGRAPHQNLLGFRTSEDQKKIDEALEIVSLTSMRTRLVSDLSGGQRQRAFVAMCIAQDTPYVLFDEPTSFLDVKYQYEVLDLLDQLHRQGKTVVAVLHDIAQAARYATDLLVLKQGELDRSGPPDTVVTASMIHQVYGLKTLVYNDPVTGTKTLSPLKSKPQSDQSTAA